MTAQDSPTRVAAERLRNRKERVIEVWLKRVRDHLEAAKSTNGPELVDSIPKVLDRVAEALASPEPDRDLQPAEAWMGIEHGQHRAERTAYSLEQLIVEIQLLHDAMLDILDEGGRIDHESRDLISRATLLAIRNAAAEFARVRREAAQSALRESDTRFRHMVEAVKDYAIFTVDPQGYITSWNVGCVRMKRYTPEEAIGQHFSMLYPEEGRRRAEPMAHLRTASIEGRFRGEGIRIRKGGEQFFADICITPISEGGEVIGFTKVVQDLTERNSLMQERDLSRSDSERLRAEASYREQFLATLTHDLRTPLTTAVMAAELIQSKADDTERVRSLGTKISHALERADRMISDLLDGSRIDAGEPLALEFSHCDAKTIAEELLDELRAQHGDRFRLEIDGPTAGFWSADGLRRVLENLLSNAIKYGDAAHPITVRLRRTEDHLLLSVHNFGTLIPEDEQQNLFRAFHRAPMAQRSGKPGWGIGLTLVKGIAEAHGGIVKAESYLKEGTTFTVDLPVDGAASARSWNRESTSSQT